MSQERCTLLAARGASGVQEPRGADPEGDEAR